MESATIAAPARAALSRTAAPDPAALSRTDTVIELRGVPKVHRKRVRTESGRHEFAFDATHLKLSELLDQAPTQTEVLDVETHRTPIDQVVADRYEQWLSTQLLRTDGQP